MVGLNIGAVPGAATENMRSRARSGLWPAIAAALAMVGLGIPAFAAPAAAQPESNAVAQAMRYESGASVPRDYRHAVALYCEAARRGDPAAFYHLGWMYLNGRGVAHDDATAVMWLRKAAGRGVTQAENLLALLARVQPAAAGGCPSRETTSIALTGRPVTMAAAPPAIRAVIDEAARNVGINAHLLDSVISVESGFNPRAVSPKMAAGLMQLMPETAARFGVRDRFDPRENVHGGAVYLRSLIEMFRGDLTLALAAYNAGEQAVLNRGGVPPYQETINYVAAVKRLCACGR